MLKKNVLFIVLTVSLFACKKSSNSNDCISTGGVPTAAEVTNVQNYLTSKGITATLDSRGFYYDIIGTGYGTPPNTASTVTVKYKGTLTNGTVFDSTATGTTATFPLSGVIRGWQYGVPLVKKAGVINLYLPPSLGYGCQASGAIPSSSITIFRIELVSY